MTFFHKELKCQKKLQADVAHNKNVIIFTALKTNAMVFIITFLILYGLGLGICYLTTSLLSGTDAKLLKNIALVPILNVIVSILIIFFMFYLVKDYRKNVKKVEDKKPGMAQN